MTISTLLLVFICTAFVGVHVGPFQALMFFTIWTIGLGVTARLISRFGYPIPGAEPTATATGSRQLDFVLAALWPAGLPILAGYLITRRLSR
ncbi:hypothetical protein [Bradyrhizobium sp. WSM3983]|uniref:hypothetical protein n=1 Tax=Bradyrhizobium sp. WSM3983 TaxID=1038867 RepID=UPI00047FE23F|nr:hypothetical protein [Bradyrhizobium sp. WSM3983]